MFEGCWLTPSAAPDYAWIWDGIHNCICQGSPQRERQPAQTLSPLQQPCGETDPVMLSC
jgi:hypothetical protein